MTARSNKICKKREEKKNNIVKLFFFFFNDDDEYGGMIRESEKGGGFKSFLFLSLRDLLCFYGCSKNIFLKSKNSAEVERGAGCLKFECWVGGGYQSSFFGQ